MLRCRRERPPKGYFLALQSRSIADYWEISEDEDSSEVEMEELLVPQLLIVSSQMTCLKFAELLLITITRYYYDAGSLIICFWINNYRGGRSI